jgi:hypothetical protein
MDITTHFDTGISDSGDSGSPLLCDGIVVGVASFKSDGEWPAHQETTYRTVRMGWLRPRMAPPGDVNANGASDIALVGAAGATTIPVAFSLGGGSFVTTTIAESVFPGLAAQSGAKPVAGDFNGDGRADIALVGAVGWTSIPVAGDFNGDGRGDIALVGGAGWTTVPVALSTGMGAFTVVNFGLATFPGRATVAGQGRRGRLQRRRRGRHRAGRGERVPSCDDQAETCTEGWDLIRERAPLEPASSTVRADPELPTPADPVAPATAASPKTWRLFEEQPATPPSSASALNLARDDTPDL